MTSPAQTVGPYFHFCLPWEQGPYAVTTDTPGAITISGHVRDGDGVGIGDAMIETWQADPAGRFDHPDDPRGAVATVGRGFTRTRTDAEGFFTLVTVKPGPLPGLAEGTVQAPHLDVSVFARGLLNRVVTRVYFPDEEAANAADPVLSSLPEPARRHTLIATAEAGGLRFDINMQGPDETVFFVV